MPNGDLWGDIRSWITSGDEEKFKAYQKAGGKLSIVRWREAGRPTQDALTLSPHAMAVLKAGKVEPTITGYVPSELTPAEKAAAARVTIAATKKEEKLKEEKLTEGVKPEGEWTGKIKQEGDLIIPEYKRPDGTTYYNWDKVKPIGRAPTEPAPLPKPTETETLVAENLRRQMAASKQAWDDLAADGITEGKTVTLADGSTGMYVRDPQTGGPLWKQKTEPTWRQPPQAPYRFPQPAMSPPEDSFGRKATWDATAGEWKPAPNWDIDPATLKAGYTPPRYLSKPPSSPPKDAYGREATWDGSDDRWIYPPDWNKDPATLQPGYLSPETKATLDFYREKADWEKAEGERNRLLQQQLATQQQSAQEALQRGMIGWYTQQQSANLQAEREARLAQLRANPASWLEYASYANEVPTVQPWMLPLSYQQQGFQVGQPLPGYKEDQKQMSLPQLQTPSAQYWSQIGPTAQQQYTGYEKARTGQIPAETEFRLWSGAPPSGRYVGARYTRR